MAYDEHIWDYYNHLSFILPMNTEAWAFAVDRCLEMIEETLAFNTRTLN